MKFVELSETCLLDLNEIAGIWCGGPDSRSGKEVTVIVFKNGKERSLFFSTKEVVSKVKAFYKEGPYR